MPDLRHVKETLREALGASEKALKASHNPTHQKRLRPLVKRLRASHEYLSYAFPDDPSEKAK